MAKRVVVFVRSLHGPSELLRVEFGEDLTTSGTVEEFLENYYQKRASRRIDQKARS